MRILITGGGNGLGKYITEHFTINNRYEVIVVDKVGLDSLDDAFISKIGNYYQVDLNNNRELADFLDNLNKCELYPDVIINNASIRNFKPFYKFTNEEITRYLNVNLYAGFVLINQFIPYMKEKRYGRIINIASRSGFWGYSTGSLYCATKAALIKYTESIARDLKTECNNLTANAICPDSFRDQNEYAIKGNEWIMPRIAKVIDKIISSKCNGKIIPVLSKKDLFVEFMKDIYKYIKWSYV